jgi:microsomal dipeptidase-like Zn-dependent dipeptidase
MVEGGLDVGLSVIYIPEAGWFDDIPILGLAKYLKPGTWKKMASVTFFQGAMNAMDEMESQVDNWNNPSLTENRRRISFAKSPFELKEGVNSGDLCLVHAVEGAHHLHGEVGGKRVGDSIYSTDEEILAEMLANLDILHARGVAYLTPAHFYPNHVVSPVFPYPEYALKFARKDMWGKWDHNDGFTSVGEAVIEKMFELGMLVDVSHCTPVARARIYEMAESHKAHSQVIATHVGAAAINPDPYNLEDWEIRWIAGNGGVVGVIFMNYWLSPVEDKAGGKWLSLTIDHLRRTGGDDVVGIGTDFDGFTDPPDDIPDMSYLPRFTRGLYSEFQGLHRKYDDNTLRKYLGGNALRVLSEGWRV